MPKAPLNQRKSFGKGEILQKPILPLASDISKCLGQIKSNLQKEQNNLIDLWQNWTSLLGEPLASNCKPVTLIKGTLTISANQPQWLQALQYNRQQLLASLQASGKTITEIRIKRSFHEHTKAKVLESELDIWGRHPSRADIHGLSECKQCHSPAPAGEMAIWGKCGFCRRKEISDQDQ